MIVLGVLVLIYACTFPYQGNAALSPMVLPFLAGGALTVFALFDYRQNKKMNLRNLKLQELMLPLTALAFLLAYLLLMRFVGFIIATFVVTTAFIVLLGGKKKTAPAIGLGLSLSLYGIFQLLLKVGLP